MRVEQTAGDVQAELRVEFADAGGAGDVDLGQPVADHVEADERMPRRRISGADLGRDPAVALGSAGGLRRVRRRRGCRGTRRPCGIRARQ